MSITPNGKLALTADNGNGGSSDGNVDTVSVIDLEANPIRVIDHVTVGDSPEGLAISPKGNLAVSHRGARLEPAEGQLVPPSRRRGQRAEDRRQESDQDRRESRSANLPEGAVFSADGSHLYVGNFIDPICRC